MMPHPLRCSITDAVSGCGYATFNTFSTRVSRREIRLELNGFTGYRDGGQSQGRG